MQYLTVDMQIDAHTAGYYAYQPGSSHQLFSTSCLMYVNRTHVARQAFALLVGQEGLGIPKVLYIHALFDD